jgi:hypothetical protein
MPPATQIVSVVPGYVQQVLPVPQAAHGQVRHEGEVKNCAHWPATQT